MNNLQEKVHHVFDYLHKNAEISWEEVETTEYIKQVLSENNCETVTFDNCTGVIGKYGNFGKDIPVVAVRADIDALWQEVNGEFQANHSCGHDAHMSIVLGLLWKLEHQPDLRDKIAIKLIFQPAEEVGTGALTMVEQGAVEDVDYLYGVHLRPIEETRMGQATPVIVHGATRMYRVEIKGEDAHGARPHLNENAIEICTQIVTMINQIYLDPKTPYSAKMTQLQAGGKSANIIPGNATFSLDLRAQTNDAIDQLASKVEKIFETIKTLYGVQVNILHTDGIAAAKTNDEAISIMQSAIENALGKEAVVPPLVTPGGDDFHFYTIKKPELKATMLGLGCDLKPGLHHPYMTFDKSALMNGVEILYQAVLSTYNVKAE